MKKVSLFIIYLIRGEKVNGTYYQNPTFPTATTNNYQDNIVPVGTNLTMEQSYIENILRLNKGKKVKAYFAFPDSLDWKDSIFNGIVEEAGRDHLILSNPETGKWYLLPMIYMNFIEFDEKINYTI